jgi:glutamyl-tRNA reductase
MHINLAGINHQNAPLHTREKVAISTENLPPFLEKMREYLPGGVILSTCNRTEIYSADNDLDKIRKATREFLMATMDISEADLEKYIYLAADREAARHLLRVSCGLESMVLGEFEVLSQVSQAMDAAEKAGVMNAPLRYLFQAAVRTGRLVRRNTGISRNPISTSSVAVDKAASVLGDIRKCKILIIGAGEAGRLVIKVCRERGATDIVVASRTLERAQALASKLSGRPVDLSGLRAEIKNADLAVTCSSAPHWILNSARVKTAMENRERPLVIIDIAVPRNVEPEAGRIPGVSLYNIDDLQRTVESNRKQREGEMEKAEAIIEKELDKFISNWNELGIQPTISALMSRAESIRRAQVKRTVKKLPELSPEAIARIETMTRSLVTRILQDPIDYLKEGNGIKNDRAASLNEIFKLEDDKQE